MTNDLGPYAERLREQLMAAAHREQTKRLERTARRWRLLYRLSIGATIAALGLLVWSIYELVR